MTHSCYLILGAGGAGRTAAAVLERQLASQGRKALDPSAIAFLDDRLVGQTVNGYQVVGPSTEARQRLCGAGKRPEGLVAFGTLSLKARRSLFEELREGGAEFCNAIDPSAVVDRTVRLGRGNLIAAQCVVNPNAVVGNNCFLCVSTTIDHDTVVGHHVYCSPGVNLGGAVIVEDEVFLGTNATVLPQVRLGRGAIIGAGAVVLRDVPPATTIVGNPARVLRTQGVSA